MWQDEARPRARARHGPDHSPTEEYQLRFYSYGVTVMALLFSTVIVLQWWSLVLVLRLWCYCYGVTVEEEARPRASKPQGPDVIPTCNSDGDSGVTLILNCCCTIVILLLHCYHTVFTLVLHCENTVVTLLSNAKVLVSSTGNRRCQRWTVMVLVNDVNGEYTPRSWSHSYRLVCEASCYCHFYPNSFDF